MEEGSLSTKNEKNLESDHPDHPELCASTILQNCSDFREETGTMETLIFDRGHLCLFLSKGHP